MFPHGRAPASVAWKDRGVGTILVGTDDGLHAFGPGGSLVGREFAGRAVTALGREEDAVWAIVDRNEVWRTEGAAPWTLRATIEGPAATCIADTRGGALIGTAGAHLRRVDGDRITPVDSFESVAGRAAWYTPWGGPPDTRSISEDDDAVFVNVHVGGIVRTLDGGVTWVPTIDIDADVHKVWAGWGRVFAACARGVAQSGDVGETWTMRSDGLHATYCRGVAICGGTLLVSASTGPRGGRAAVYRGSIEGGAFEPCRRGLPEWFDDNIDSACLDAVPRDGQVVFGTADGRVFSSSDEGESWEQVVDGLAAIRCVLPIP